MTDGQPHGWKGSFSDVFAIVFEVPNDKWVANLSQITYRADLRLFLNTLYLNNLVTKTGLLENSERKARKTD